MCVNEHLLPGVNSQTLKNWRTGSPELRELRVMPRLWRASVVAREGMVRLRAPQSKPYCLSGDAPTGTNNGSYRGTQRVAQRAVRRDMTPLVDSARIRAEVRDIQKAVAMLACIQCAAECGERSRKLTRLTGVHLKRVSSRSGFDASAFRRCHSDTCSILGRDC